MIWDLAPHDISILLYLFGKTPEQIKVQAHAHIQRGIHDVAHLDLGYADGMNAHIHVSWLHPCKIRRVTVIGDASMVVYDDTNPAEMIKVYNKGATVDADPVVSYRYGKITIPHIDWIEPLRLDVKTSFPLFARETSRVPMGKWVWKWYACLRKRKKLLSSKNA